jgi:hypothetical protein
MAITHTTLVKIAATFAATSGECAQAEHACDHAAVSLPSRITGPRILCIIGHVVCSPHGRLDQPGDHVEAAESLAGSDKGAARWSTKTGTNTGR